MKITGTRTELVELPADEPLAGAAENPNGKRPIVTVSVETDQGVEGLGVAYFGGALSRTLRHAIDELGALCIGEDPVRVEAVQQKLKNAAGGLFWLEDVTTADDFAGLARISDALSTPVAGGEYVWGIAPFRHMLEARSVDIPMIDLVRVGGITQWLKVAGMAEAFNLPVVSHLIPEVHVHLIGAVPNGLTVEYMPWLVPLFTEVPVQQNGELAMPTTPGLGLEFDQATIERYRA